MDNKKKQLIEALKKHHAQRMAVDMQSMEVPELLIDGNPLVVYCRPITWGETQELFKGLQESGLEFVYQTVRMRALDENGERIFDDTVLSLTELELDPTLIQRIGNWINETFPLQTSEDAAKN